MRIANDGHDTSVTTAGAWTKSFLEPLLTNSNFMSNTLVLLSESRYHKIIPAPLDIILQCCT